MPELSAHKLPFDRSPHAGVLCEVEGFALVMLCNCRPITRKLAVLLLKEVKSLFSILGFSKVRWLLLSTCDMFIWVQVIHVSNQQHNHFLRCKMQVNSAKKTRQSGKQNETLTCLARQVMFWAGSSQWNSPLFNRVAGQVDVPAGQVNSRGSLPPLGK